MVRPLLENLKPIAQFRYNISAWETGDETPTPKQGSGANNKNKHNTVITARKAMCVWWIVNSQCFFFWSTAVCVHCMCTMVTGCAVALCHNRSKKRPDLSYLCFPARPNEWQNWEVFCKWADKKFKTLGNLRIYSLHFKKSDIEISVSGSKRVCSYRCLTIFDPTKSMNTVISRLKRLANRKRQCEK